MSNEIVRRKTPEEEELDKKRAELGELESELAQRELDLVNLQAELRSFEGRYLRIVGTKYAELDALEAQIAEFLARQYPENQQARERASRARTQAKESARATSEAHVPEQRGGSKPSEELRRLYYAVAKQVHPDLTTDSKERERRQRLMAEANLAYEEGNEQKLREILHKWESGHESVKGEGIAAELVRVIRKIAQVRDRLHSIGTEMAQLHRSDLWQLKVEVEQAAHGGRDLLAELAATVDQKIEDARQRLRIILEEGT